MKVNHVRYSSSLKLFLGALLAACFLAPAAHADSLFKGTFTLTNEVHWGKALLGPGSYSLAVDPATQIISIRDAHTGKVVACEFARLSYNTGNDDHKLLITVRGRQSEVYSLRLAGLGEVFQQAHPSESGRAAEESRNAGTTPVEVAKN